MALLFLKQKLFPGQETKMHSKPLLARIDDEETIRGDSDQDIESQRSYDTFGRCVSNDGSTSSSTTRSRINPRIISDAILGLSDGLTVPFALSAGLSALGNTKVVVLGGLAELAAGAISMGLGGYVGAKSEAESYEATVRETRELIESDPSETHNIVRDTFAPYGLSPSAINDITRDLHASHERLLEFLLAFHHRETAPDCNQAWISALTLAIGYFVGGFIPLIPYFIVSQVMTALYWSIGVMGVTLLVFGYVKTCVVRGWTGHDNVVAGIWGGVQMVCVGGVAAGAAIALVRLIDTGSA
ncbi:Vacuolar iron transporter cccA [Penicillium subrubescens]|uniref:Protein CCC1 n=1 Tax=Penicillium subrubescens TaxID=1316194 RepID=A0A1Q5SXN8_9EURO|nr:Vacuolar iron transporter cccA [Penicillium subrubescens]KAJ5905417.1 Vacuolar iron transporter cccA [Penicillium subrubescens]OKO92787.1 Protein CCC1 [Penicillium subrubescens]